MSLKKASLSTSDRYIFSHVNLTPSRETGPKITYPANVSQKVFADGEVDTEETQEKEPADLYDNQTTDRIEEGYRIMFDSENE